MTITPVPDGVKLTFPGPSVTLVYDAASFGVGSKTTLSSVTLLTYEALYPSRVTVEEFPPV